MKITSKAILALLILSISLVAAQDIQNAAGTNFYDVTEGYMYRHIWSTSIYITSTYDSQTLVVTFPIEGTRFDADQYVHIGLGLVRLDSEAAATPKIHSHLQVKSAVLNAGRTLFTLTLVVRLADKTIHMLFTKIGYHVLFIGSKFNSAANGGVSAAMARISQFTKVTDTASATVIENAVQFTFQGLNGEASPFAFTPDAADILLCGVKRDGDVFKIEAVGCLTRGQNIFLTYINGFRQTQIGASTGRSVASLLNSGVSAGSGLATLVTTGLTSIDVNQNTPGSAGTPDPTYIYKTSATDTQYGLFINYEGADTATNPLLQYVQFTLVYFGIRETKNTASTKTYPTQSTYKDQFVVAAGYHIDTTTDMVLTTGSQLVDIIGTVANLVQTTYYPATPAVNFGTAFCGVQLMNDYFKFDLKFIEDSSNNYMLANNDDLTATSAKLGGSCIFVSSKTICSSNKNVLKELSSTTYKNEVLTTEYTVTPVGSTENTLTLPLVYKYEIKNYNSDGDTRTTATINATFKVPPTTDAILYLQFKTLLGTAVVPSFPTGKLSYTVQIGDQLYGITNLTSNSYSTNIPYTIPSTTTTEIPISLTFYAENIPDSTLKDIYTNILIGMYYYSSVITDVGSGCDSKCPVKTGFSSGLDLTTDPPTCIYCSTTSNLVYSGELNDGKGGCGCKLFSCLSSATQSTAPTVNTVGSTTTFAFSADQEVCLPTTDPLCAICTATLLASSTTEYKDPVCDRCTENAYLTTDLKCLCQTGYYPDGSVCKICPVGCSACTSATSCTECKPSAPSGGIATRLGPSDLCACIPGYYESNVTAYASPVCLKCDASCLTCNATGSCLSCDRLKNLVLNNTQCVCIEGFYLLGNECRKCAFGCRTCDFSSSYCLNCTESRVLTPTQDVRFGTCKCKPGFVEIGESCVDQSCMGIDPYCKECLLDLNNLQIRSCLSCADNRAIIDGKCICKAGFYEAENKTCVPCSSGCQKCSSSSVCEVCAIGANNLNNGSCSCQTGFYLFFFTESLYCKPCSRSCASCEVTQSTCLSCNTGFVLNGQDCTCAKGQYLANPTDSQCTNCGANCEKCSGPLQCDKCQDSYVFDSLTKQCSLTCRDGTFNGGSRCIDCPQGCTSCVHSWICLTCAPTYYMFAGSCLTVCPDNFYPENTQCRACSPRCQTCRNDRTCTSCRPPFILLGDSCVEDCPNGTFYAGGSCLSCNQTCLTCRGSSQFCTSCAPSLIYYNDSCYTQCPGVSIGGVCQQSCPGGKYLSNKNCLDCNTQCVTCSGSASYCTACKTGFSNNGVCISKCPDGSYAGDQSCKPCDISCKTCTQTSTSCTECATDFIRAGANCIKRCPNGYFYDIANRLCASCGNDCKQCSSLTQCTVCNDPRQTPVDGECKANCPSGATLNGDTCVCNFGLLHLSACVQTCPQGFFALNRVCARCSDSCLTCSGSASSCLSCKDGFTYNPSTRTCTGSGQCLYGQILRENGICVRICGLNSYFFNSGCVSECLPGYRPENGLACVQEISDTFCAPPLFRSGNSCVGTCPAGFYPNSANRECQVCSPNCQFCLSQNLCITCVQGYVWNSDERRCAASQCAQNQVQYNSVCYSECPIGSYQAGRLCLRSCQDGTYFNPRDNYCYTNCPTQLLSDDVCFDQCPIGHRCRRV